MYSIPSSAEQQMQTLYKGQFPSSVNSILDPMILQIYQPQNKDQWNIHRSEGTWPQKYEPALLAQIKRKKGTHNQ